jgi:hypothetical protein
MNEPTAEELELIRIAPAVEAATNMAMGALKADHAEIASVTYDHDASNDLVTVSVELIDGCKATGKAFVSAKSPNPRGRLH